MKKNIILMTLTCLFLFLCKDMKGEGKSIPEIQFSQISSRESSITSFFKKVSFVQLEINDNCMISEIKRVLDVSGRVVVLSSDNKIYSFDKKTGKFLNQIGNIGEGPEEYIEVTDIYPSADKMQICVVDRMRNDILTYQLNGKYCGKEPITANIAWAESIERAGDGSLFVCNQLSAGKPASEYPFTIIKPDKSSYGIDQFNPICVKDYATKFATRPMAVTSKGLTFFKFYNDTLFSYGNGNIKPIYKLKLDKSFPSKDMLAKMGNYDQALPLRMEKALNSFTGFDCLFETNKLILLVPVFCNSEGYYWIDKQSGKGIHIGSSNNVNDEMDKMLQGKTILYVKSSNDNELISCYDPEIIDVVKRELSKQKTMKLFNNNLSNFFRSVNSEGNPVLIFYKH